MHEVVMVRVGSGGKIAHYESPYVRPSIGDFVIVETDRGTEYGEVLSDPQIVFDADIEKPLKKIVRLATEEDLVKIEENSQKVAEAFRVCEQKIKERNLIMKLVDVDYAFDGSKIIFYFTAEGRVDFRELVKDLARVFKARIELKQIGVRDEAKLLGGFGHCGRPLCCAKFLKDFEPVTIKMAKEQNLPLNPSKISGLCGRLMCCLGYEHSLYKKYLKGLPKVGQVVKTKEGAGKVISVDVLKRKVIIEFEDERQVEIDYPLKHGFLERKEKEK